MLPTTASEWWAKGKAMVEGGDERAGAVGVACPKCWKKIPAHRVLPFVEKAKDYCIHEVADPSEILRAHGLDGYLSRLTTNNEEIVRD